MLWTRLSTLLMSRLTGFRERQRPPIRRGVAFLLLAAPLGALFLLPGDSRSQEVSYSVIPTYQVIRWDDAFGLERARLFGARASLDFGPFFSLEPFYAWKDDVGIRNGLPLPEGAESSESFDVKAFGADMQVNLARGSLVPFLRGGGGILRTQDEAAGERDRIFLRGGGGVRVGLGGSAGLELSAERWATRLEAPLVPGAVSEEDFPDDGIVNSTVFGAGVRIPFGGESRDTEGVSGILPGIFVEPYAGRIDFADELRLEKQYLAGARAGVDLNRNVGLRAYYWKGVVDDFTDWMDLVGYGAEAQFALNTGSGLSPFLLAGAGRIDFEGDYQDLDGEPRTKENHLTLGGGAAFWLGNNVRVQLGVRDLLMTAGTELEDVTDPDELVSNWQYSVGLSFSFGARGQTTAERATDRESARQEAELERLAEENRRLRAGEIPAGTERAETRGDTMPAGRTMTIPVPEVGEVILRYGEAYAVRVLPPAEGGTIPDTLSALREIMEARLPEMVRATVRDELDRVVMAAGDTTQARLQRELLEARLPEMIRQITREELGRAGVQPTAGQPATEAVTRAGPRGESFLEDGRLHALFPFTGMQISSPTQLLLGVRGDLGRIRGPIPLTLLPEISLGLGEGETTLRVSVLGRISWNLDLRHNLTPYGQVGVSVTNRRFLSIDPAWGVTFDAFGSSARDPVNLFVEHRGVAFFKENQILVGVNLPR